jgi:hypothetical protein
MSDEDAFTVETKLTRGTSTDDRDTIKATVSANSLGELEEKLSSVRQRLEDHATLVRSIQPDQNGRTLPDDQSCLDEIEA